MKVKLVERVNPTDRKQVKFYANAINAGKCEMHLA